MAHTRLLFILKRRTPHYDNSPVAEGDSSDDALNLSTGLYNSVGFVVSMLNWRGVDAKMVVVYDNNDINREVTRYRPSHVIIEAFWVVPSKFDVLKRLHPEVHWIVRNHSSAPFLATEGNAMDWIAEYLERGIEVQSNSRNGARELRSYAQACGLRPEGLTYLPNYYPPPPDIERWRRDGHMHGDRTVDIGCFGAIRPLKNQLIQALAAMEFADSNSLRLRFHINGGRVEGRGEPILKNLEAAFSHTRRHALVEHPWLTRERFLEVLRRRIDIVMQVSLSETFNVIAADGVSQRVPVVASSEISWLQSKLPASATTNVFMIAEGLQVAWDSDQDWLQRQRYDLAEFSDMARGMWLRRFGGAGAGAWFKRAL